MKHKMGEFVSFSRTRIKYYDIYMKSIKIYASENVSFLNPDQTYMSMNNSTSRLNNKFYKRLFVVLPPISVFKPMHGQINME